jgi:tetratricopeptide (TPR) repeat protein
MNQLAQRLMMLHDRPLSSSDNLTTMLGGSTTELPTSLTRTAFRLGLWPIIWPEKAEEGLGIACILAYLLERWQEIRIYRLLAHLPEELGTYTWQVSDSAFTPDDWQLEPLDENTALWGEIQQTDDAQQLVLTLENDLIDDEDDATRTFTYVFTDVADLVRQLPQVASDIAEFIGAVYVQEIQTVYTVPADIPNPDKLDAFLRRLFQWELRLQLWLSGRDWAEESLVQAYQDLKQAAKETDLDAAKWAFARAVGSVIALPGYQTLGTSLVPLVATTVAELDDSRLVTPILASALYESGNPDDAYYLLDVEIENHPENVPAWLTLADLYNQSGRLQEAIAVFQDAIEDAKLVNRVLYFYYANSILAADRYGVPVSDFVFVSPENQDDDTIRREAISAYREALKLESDNKHVLYGLVLRLLELNEPEVWQTFPALLRVDTNGDLIRAVVDNMASMDDLQPAIDALKSASAASPQRLDLSISLGAVLISAERYDEAADLLNDVEKQTLTPAQHSDVERLLLITEMPDFESKFAELSALIGARHSPSEADVDFLEEVAEQAPTLTEVHLLLAKSYQAWNDRQAALEVLLDAQKELPEDPDILLALAETLWHMGEEETAFQYLNKGLSEHPNHIGLLAKTGLFLFENEQEEQAKRYLSRAEAIDRRDPLLAEVRAVIAARVNEDPSLVDDSEDE